MIRVSDHMRVENTEAISAAPTFGHTGISINGSTST